MDENVSCPYLRAGRTAFTRVIAGVNAIATAIASTLVSHLMAARLKHRAMLRLESSVQRNESYAEVERLDIRDK